MQTNLADFIRDTPDGDEADAILRKCVHCGFCTATCPTYQLLGDELDSPRGRIYLIKRVLEGETATAQTQLHLDRCLTCRNCETTCPSGVQYGRLVDIGRKVVEQQVGRTAVQSTQRGLLKEGLTSPLFGPAMKLGQLVRPLLPATLKRKVPAAVAPGVWPAQTHARKVLLLTGCVQPAMAPNINSATARVLDALDIQCLTPSAAGCCGAIRYHLNDHEGGLSDARRNIDAWWPAIEAGAEAIVINASGCGTQVKDYGHLLARDPAYADKARRVSALARDLAELLPSLLDQLTEKLRATTPITAHHAHSLSSAPAAAPAVINTGNKPTSDLTDYTDPSAHLHDESSDPTDADTDPPTLDVDDLIPLNDTLHPPLDPPRRLAFHPPCSLQHGQQIRGAVEDVLTRLGADLLPFAESHLCCGSAGTYSVLQPVLADALRDRKLEHLRAVQPQVILSANIGCITHLQSGTQIPVMHWIEWVDRLLINAAKSASRSSR